VKGRIKIFLKQGEREVKSRNQNEDHQNASKTAGENPSVSTVGWGRGEKTGQGDEEVAQNMLRIKSKRREERRRMKGGY